jgi:hypothetical protein
MMTYSGGLLLAYFVFGIISIANHSNIALINVAYQRCDNSDTAG